MASSSTWFARSAPSGKGEYELPRWRPPASMAASIIPAPIVQGNYRPSPKLSTVLPSQSIILDKPVTAASRESELQADLQFLLDAQAEGLIRGVEGGVDETSSQGSTTPVARQPRHLGRPIRKRLGLRSARKGIYNCIMSLAEIKSEEISSADGTLGEKTADLAQIDAWKDKRERLSKAADELDTEEENIRIQRLQQEGDTLQAEINRAEMHLMELKSKRRTVLKQAAAIENAVQAKLASYTTSLNLLDTDIKTFLNTQSLDLARSARVKHSKQSTQGDELLEMAKQQLGTEHHELESQLKELQFEGQALQEGAQMWKDVVSQVTAFEKRLRSEMSNLSESTMAWDDAPQASPSERLTKLYQHMLTLLSNLEEQYKHAETNNWRLLVAAIGAELDALRRGKQILDGLVGSQQDAGNSSNEGEQHMLDNTTEPQQHHGRGNGRSDTDDEPDPDLLFSVQDEDDADE